MPLTVLIHAQDSREPALGMPLPKGLSPPAIIVLKLQSKIAFTVNDVKGNIEIDVKDNKAIRNVNSWLAPPKTDGDGDNDIGSLVDVRGDYGEGGRNVEVDVVIVS
ncbi:635_t:CDS:2 [Diversispora eburnea]|uniref:635_t:CDS:1 n=1 Tax=Diversispora eburnea TaxID=1213867 RepID=A0A9N9AKD3_9GLOM|nr:635_t:CDS:2 [Diversispora eburnea]